jgi:hypothetical protein
LLGNDRETNDNATAVANQQILNKQQLSYNRGTDRNGVFYWASAKILYNEDTSRGTVS